eukprot:14346978-Alexandrium_andersonii.AAC.1
MCIRDRSLTRRVHLRPLYHRASLADCQSRHATARPSTSVRRRWARVSQRHRWRFPAQAPRPRLTCPPMR